MSINDKYLDTLKQINGWVTISEWAIKFGEIYPDLLDAAHKQALSQKKPSTGLREIAARMSSQLSRGAFGKEIEINDEDRPKRVRYITKDQFKEREDRQIEEDTEPFTRAEIIKAAIENLSTKELYRLNEMESIASSLNSYFKLDFEVDHALALLNRENPGAHHPNNLQILLKSHNRTKSNTNWTRFTLDEQIEYIKSAIKTQSIVAKKMEIELDESVIDSIIQRLKLIYLT